MQIKYDDFKNYKIITQIAGQFSKNKHKSIDMVVVPFERTIYYVVYNHREKIATMQDLRDAIYLFNKII